MGQRNRTEDSARQHRTDMTGQDKRIEDKNIPGNRTGSECRTEDNKGDETGQGTG